MLLDKSYIESLVEKNRIYYKQGKVANYIPELSKMKADQLGVYIVGKNGLEIGIGDYNTIFSIQSISKILTFILAILDRGEEKVFSKIGSEPSGDAFNSIIKLEVSKLKKPYNPMINAGAIGISSMIYGETSTERVEKVLKLARLLANNQDINIMDEIYKSEKETGFRNMGIAYFLKNEGIIEGDVEVALDTYFKQCSIGITTRDLANIAFCLANRGRNIKGDVILPEKVCRYAVSLMTTCGLYDGSGNFALKCGIPTKSGVGGGLLSSVPGSLGIGVFSPPLDENGNSLVGIKFLTELSDSLKLSIF
ncbi:glutaminase A [Cetobacterium somerae]|uniref:glutaminase A n=1 Tax=Cetobacterium somerae TaxID=188913 RepID=UPI00248E5211|nr:glutaminase A [Cetobacterium somerae]